MPRARRVGPQHLTGCDEVGFVPLHEGRWTGSSRQVLTPPPFLRKKKRELAVVRRSWDGWFHGRSWKFDMLELAGAGQHQEEERGGKKIGEGGGIRSKIGGEGWAWRLASVRSTIVLYTFLFILTLEFLSLSLSFSLSLSIVRALFCLLFKLLHIYREGTLQSVLLYIVTLRE